MPTRLRLARAGLLIAIVGGDPLEHQKVLGYTVRRAAERGARSAAVASTHSGR